MAAAPDWDVVGADVHLRVLHVADASLRALELQLHHELALQLRREVAPRPTCDTRHTGS